MSVPTRAGADLRLLRAAAFAAVCVTLAAAGHEMASAARIPVWALLAGWAGVFAVAAPLAGRERSLPGIAALMLTGQLALHAVFSTGQWCAAPATGAAAGAAGGATGDGSAAARMTAFAGRLVCHGAALRLTPATAIRLIRRAGIDPASVAGGGSALRGPSETAGMPSMPGMPGMASAAGAHGAQAVQGAHGAAALTGMPGIAHVSPGQGMSGMQGAMGYTLPMVCVHLAAALIAGWLLWRGEAALWRLVRLSAYAASRVAARFPLVAAVAAMRALRLTAVARTRPPVRRRRRGPDDAGGGPESVTLRHCVVRRGPPRLALAA